MLEEYVAKYGETYRKLIEDALNWLDEKEPTWNVTLRRDDFIEELVRGSYVKSKS
jgi:hypothetical protein